MKRKLAFAISGVLLLTTAYLGIRNGVTEWSDAHTFWQRTVTGGVLLYGVLALAACVGLAARKRWSYVVTLVWGAVVTYVAATAVVAYGDGSVGAAAAAGGSTAVATGLIAWAVRVATRAPAPAL